MPADTVPVPALYNASPTPPTCDTAGSFDLSGDHPHVTVKVDPVYTGPGTYTLTITADDGYEFPDHTTVKSRTITVLPKLSGEACQVVIPVTPQASGTPDDCDSDPFGTITVVPTPGVTYSCRMARPSPGPLRRTAPTR